MSDRNEGSLRWYDTNEDLEKEAVSLIKSQQAKISKLTVFLFYKNYILE